jgi:hypothetical protein
MEPGTTKTKNFTFRAENSLHEALRKAAQASNRSVSDEIGDRLRRSFDPDLDVDKVFASPEMFALMRVLAATMESAGREAATIKSGVDVDHWFRDAYAFNQAHYALERLLEIVRPTAEASPPVVKVSENDTSEEAERAQLRNRYVRQIGRFHADATLSQLRLDYGMGARLRRGLDPVWLERLPSIREGENDNG